ncbi:amino acid kinase family protein [Geodermatophilus sp. CPCC 205761]|uniref:amino acid kinase family protein n=1 Tax=Geodermatophilus sp. CPCC 205761 TaxID=2936597 RepID=UPI003EEB8659
MAIDSALARRGMSTRAVAVLTHAEVARDDPAFAAPTKPIGSHLSPAVARLLAAKEGWTVTETSAGVFRRVVASPRPLRIVETDQIRSLLDTDAVVIAAGGGGIPVLREDGGWRSVDAVIDKDRASALLAAIAGVDTLVLVTGVDQVYVGFGTPDQRALSDVRPDEARGYLEDGEFPAGSMGPKVESALQFLAGGGRRAVITSLPRLRDALAGRAGTSITSPGRAGPVSSPGASSAGSRRSG